MRMIILICKLAILVSIVPAAFADIYVWTDENGVKNFTNQAPPEQAEVFMTTPEIEAHTPVAATTVEMGFNEAESLQSGQLRAAQEEIETLSEQVAGLRKELRDALEPVPEPPPVDSTDVYESTAPVRYRTVYGYGSYAPYDPYGYLWHHKLKKYHRRPGYGRGGHIKALPNKHRIKHQGTNRKKIRRYGVSAGKGHSGYQKSRGIRHRSLKGGSRRHNGSRAGYRRGMPPRR